MVDDMVMRSVYLRPDEDAGLRDLAHDLEVTKSDLIRSAISLKLAEWLASNDRQRLLDEVAFGRRDEEAIRSGPRRRRRSADTDRRLAARLARKVRTASDTRTRSMVPGSPDPSPMRKHSRVKELDPVS